jgi:hypothetical protein
VSFIQKFGSTLNVHPHFHLVVSDGAFYRANGKLRMSGAFLSQDDILARRGVFPRCEKSNLSRCEYYLLVVTLV